MNTDDAEKMKIEMERARQKLAEQKDEKPISKLQPVIIPMTYARMYMKD